MDNNMELKIINIYFFNNNLLLLSIVIMPLCGDTFSSLLSSSLVGWLFNAQNLRHPMPNPKVLLIGSGLALCLSEFSILEIIHEVIMLDST
ncbi:hypothetical protein ACPV4B_04425 [Vibrio parahaemolyticus]